ITLFEHNAVDDYYNQLVEGVFAVHKELDEEYTSFLKDDWSIERIPKTSIIALRIGIYEIKKRIDIPNKVAVDQATILAETFGDSSDGRFVNGVLANFID
ncbi:transcription termination factor NusB, partial [Oenococcus alcoholitolerans]